MYNTTHRSGHAAQVGALAPHVGTGHEVQRPPLHHSVVGDEGDRALALQHRVPVL